MSKHEITLWFGDRGVRIDTHGNFYKVRRGSCDAPETPPNLADIYRSIMEDAGFKFAEQKVRDFDRNGDIVFHCRQRITYPPEKDLFSGKYYLPEQKDIAWIERMR